VCPNPRRDWDHS
jgi:hypothetical protein